MNYLSLFFFFFNFLWFLGIIIYIINLSKIKGILKKLLQGIIKDKNKKNNYIDNTINNYYYYIFFLLNIV